jgi:hypothetical protein
MNDAICAAITTEHEDNLDDLLLFYATYIPTLKHTTYNAWLEATLKTGILDIPKRVLQAKRLGSTHMSTLVFNARCRLRAVHMLPTLLKSLSDSFLGEVGTTNTASLFIAVRSGSVAAVAAVLDANRDVNID